jgi:anti-sigma regulatory factor (Ser/Thr protein kinase)
MDGRQKPAPDPASLTGAGSAAAAGSLEDPPENPAGLRIPPSLTWQEPGVKNLWPLQDFLELAAVDSAVPWGRRHARQVLQEWGIGHLGDGAELLVTELITNAVTASREMTQVCAVRLWLLSDSARILILIWDGSPDPPVLTGATDDAEHGRGLLLVDAISEQWGWYPRGDGDGKFVWAIARLRFSALPAGPAIGSASHSPCMPDGKDCRRRRSSRVRGPCIRARHPEGHAAHGLRSRGPHHYRRKGV